MPLSKQLFPLSFGQGIDTKTDAKVVVPGKLLELENGVFTKIGSIHKRDGFTRITSAIVGADAVDRADGLATFRDELLMFGDEGRVYSRSEALDGWVDRGAIVSVELTEEPVVRNTYQQINPDAATSGGLTLTAWEDDTRGGVRYSVRDDATGTWFVDDVQVSATGSGPRVVVWQGEFAIFYSVGNNIFYRRVSTTSPTAIGVEVNPVSTLDPLEPLWDVIAGSSYLFVVGNDPSVGLAHWKIGTTWAVSSRTTVAATATSGLSLWLGTNGSDIYVGHGIASEQLLVVLSSSGTVLVAATAIGTEAYSNCMTGVALSNSEGVVFFDTTSATKSIRYHITGSTIAGDAALAVGRGLRPIAKAFVQHGAAYCPCSWDSTYQAVCMVMGEAGEVIAKTQPGTGGGHRSNAVVANVHESSGVFTFPAATKTVWVSDGDNFFGRLGIERVTVDFTSTYRYASAELGQNLLIAGGILHAYDGRTICESGFHFFPEGVTGALGGGASGSLSAGQYQWRVTYEWTDARGQIHRSAPSLAVTKNATATDSCTLTIPTLRVTQKSDVRIVVYRTLVNGSVFYRVSSVTSPLLNSTTVDSVTYVDTAADTAINANDLLYSDGTANQELENIPPGACQLITTHRSRAFCKTAPNRVSYSKVTFDGDAPAFSDALYLQPDGRGGSITALAGMDDKVVIFKQRAIFVVSGDGPNNAGQGDYGEPQLVTSDVGCDEPRSVVLINSGLMFHSPKGIYLLDRSLSVTYIGAPVELYNNLTITSAAVVPSNNQVRFTTSGTVTLDDGQTRTNLVLVYDYMMNQWSTFTNITAVDATVWDGVYVWCKSDGRVYKEAAGTYTDDGASITLRFVTSWLSLAQLNGFQRIYRLLLLGDYKGVHTLRVRLGYDFSPEYTYDQTITPTAPGTWGSDAAWGTGAVWGGSYPLEWFRVSPARQKCSAIRICVEDVQTSGTEGLSITGIGVLAGVKGPVNKMPAGRSL